ncbi:MAG: carbohydrate kinase family protein [[Clostridium] leptum]
MIFIKILCVGLMVCDLLIKPVTRETLSADSAKAEAIRMLVGGDAFNVASNLSALGTETTLYSAVGEDAFGAFALDYAEKLGVSTQWIKTTDGPTSVTAVLIHPDGERSFVVQRGASHELKERQISDDLLRQYDLLYIGSACGIPGLDGEGLTKLLHRAKVLDCKTAMDITGNPTRRSAAQLLPALPNLDFFLPSAYEAMDLSGRDSPGKAADYFHEKGVPVVAVKMGGQGALLSAGGKQEVFPAYEGPVVDTTGAGDAFVAGFLAALSRGESLPGCVQIGNGAGAKCVERLGSSGTLPAYQELISFTGLHRE